MSIFSGGILLGLLIGLPTGIVLDMLLLRADKAAREPGKRVPGTLISALTGVPTFCLVGPWIGSPFLPALATIYFPYLLGLMAMWALLTAWPLGHFVIKLGGAFGDPHGN